MTPHEGDALRLFREALDLDADARAAFVAGRCGGDEALAARVHALLAQSEAFEEATANASPADVDTLPGTRLGPYRVVERIGRGGMGVVYRAERDADDVAQTVAIKLIRRGFDVDDVQARFLRERRILARLSHPHLARFIDGGVAPDGRPWFALEFVDGESILRWCDARRLDVKARVRLFLDVCAAVQYAHTQLVVHRDLKPGNVLVDARGAVRLLDFGIARIVGGDDGDAHATMTMAGSGYALTPEYAAPEQFAGAAAGVAADLYALGVIAYELVAGVGPYAIDRRDMAGAERIVRDVPPEALTNAIARGDDDTATAARLTARDTGAHAYRALVRGDLARILGKALAKEPERRYATVDAFAADLSRWLDGKPVQATGDHFGYRLGKFVRRNRVAVLVAGALAIGLVATSVIALRSAHLERLQREAAVAETARVNAVREYVLLMFRDAGEHGGASLSAREVLKRGAERIFTQFADQPESGQEVALSLADLFMELGDLDGGAPLLERVLAWPGIERNPDALARARYNLAQLEYSRGNARRARELLDAAQAWWMKQPTRYERILNESRTTQAQLERAEGHVDKAIATLETTIAERKRFGDADREVGAALNALTLALADAARFEDSVRAADEAMAVFRSVGADKQVAGLAVLNNRAVSLMALKQYARAVEDFRRVVALRRELYGRSPELAVAQNNLALTLVHVAREEGPEPLAKAFKEATTILEDAYPMALEFGGESSRAAVLARINLAEAYAATGRVTEAEPLAEDAVRIGHAHFGDANGFTALGYRARANVRLAQGRRDDARADVARAKAIIGTLGKIGEAYLASLAPLIDKLGERPTAQ